MTSPRTPATLGKAGQKLWKRLTADFSFPDGAALELLERACIAADRAEGARIAMEKTGGPVVLDRFDKPQRNPACVVERDATATMLSCMKLLGLHEVGEKDKGGRPLGS